MYHSAICQSDVQSRLLVFLADIFILVNLMSSILYFTLHLAGVAGCVASFTSFLVCYIFIVLRRVPFDIKTNRMLWHCVKYPARAFGSFLLSS